MNRAPYPLRKSLIVGFRSRFDGLRVLRGKAYLDYAPHRFALWQLRPTRFSFLIRLIQGF